MSKGNLFLGFARGKVGDVVFSRANGEQLTRARNRAPRNPQSALQMLQRVCMKTSSTAYSMFRPLTDHSFQGLAQGTPSQSRFTELNIARMRQQLAQEIESGNPEDILTSTETNFAAKQNTLPMMRDYQLSEGTLPSVIPFYDSNFASMPVPDALISSEFTYQQICDKLGLERGDQLTFILFACDDREDYITGEFNQMRYARIILEPNDGDMTSAFINPDTGAVNKPNVKNEGNVLFTYGNGFMSYVFPGTGWQKNTAHALCGTAIITSRHTGGVWQRSNSSIVLAPASALQWDHNVALLSDAIYSYLTDESSTLYLNQAEI